MLEAWHRRTPKQPPKQSARIVRASPHSQGSAGRAQDERIIAMTFAMNSYLLGKTHAATDAEVHEQRGTNLVFCHFVMISRLRGLLEETSKREPKMTSKSCPQGGFLEREFWVIFVLKRFWGLLMCFFSVFLHCFWEASATNLGGFRGSVWDQLALFLLMLQNCKNEFLSSSRRGCVLRALPV